MTETELLFSYVKEKAKTEGIPFSHMISAFLMEEALRILAESGDAGMWILCNQAELSASSYRESLRHTLSFYYEGTLEQKELVSMLHRLLENDHSTDIRFSFSSVLKEDQITVFVKGRYEKLEIPFEIRVRPAPEGLKSEMRELRLLCFPDKRISMRMFSAEELLAEALILIVERLELLGDLAYYERAFELLCRENINARHLFLRMEEALKERHIQAEERRMKTLKGYRDYPYMKKRWRAYLRGKHKSEPSWEEVHERIMAFLEPLWEALTEDRVFFGDWMPDLGRYLL